MGPQASFPRAIILAPSLVLFASAAVAQSLDPITLYSDETLHWDSFAIKMTGACKVPTDSRTLGIGFSELRFLDGSGSLLLSIHPNTMDGNYYMGGGWQQIGGNPALAPSLYRWTDGATPLTTFYYPTPAGAQQIEFVAITPPCGQMSAELSVNGVTAGSFSLPANSGLRTSRIPLPATLRRFVRYELRSGGALAIKGIDWLDNYAYVIGNTATPANLDSSTSVAELDAAPPPGATAWRIVLSSPPQADGSLFVGFNDASARVLSFAAQQIAIACATTDPLTRQADKKTRTAGWGDDFNARNGFRTWTLSSGYPTVQSNGATVSFAVPEGANQILYVDLLTASPMPVGDYPYLSVRLKSSKGTVYYIRPFGVDQSGQIQPLYQQDVSATEALPGTGDWQTHSISLKRLVQNLGVLNPAVTEIRLDVVNQQSAPASFEMDWIRVHKAFQPDQCAAAETDFANHLDDDCNGLMDQDDQQAWTQYAFGGKPVLAYHYPWFGTASGPSKAWVNWSGSLSDFSDPTRPAVPIRPIDPSTFDPSSPGKRNLTSRFYPLDYRQFPNYIPPADGAFHYDTYGGVDRYDSLDPGFVAAQVALAGRYGLDGFITEASYSSFLVQRFSVARDAIRASGLPFVIAPLYDFFYRYPPFGLLTERATPDMAGDLLQMHLDTTSNDHALRFAGRPVLTAPFLSFLVTPAKWQAVIGQAATPDSIPYGGTATPGQVQSGAHNRVTFTFARAEQPPGNDTRYLSVLFRSILFLDQNFHELSRFTFGTAQARAQLVSGWSVDEKDSTGETWVWAAGTQKTAALDLAIPNGAAFFQLDCSTFMDRNTTTLQINNGSIATFDVLQNGSLFTFRLTPVSPPPTGGTASKAPFALFLDSAGVGDGFLNYGEYATASRVLVSSPYPLMATVTCGYDDSKIRVPGRTTDRQDGARYRQSWEQALAGDPDLVVINTWNEWAESTNIEPSVEFGYKYLELTLTYSLVFKGLVQSSALPSELGLTVTRYAVQGTGTPEIDFNASSPSTGATIVFNNLPGGFLSGVQVTTNGQNYPNWTADYAHGTLTIRLPGNSTAFTIRPATTLPSGPTISAIFNSPSGSPVIAQNTWIAITGTNLANTTRTWQRSDFVGNKLPIQVDGVSVKVNGKPAYVYYISPTQLNVLTPADSTTGPVKVQVTTGASVSSATTVQMQPSAPAFFTFGGKYVAAVHADGSYIGPATLIPGQTTPARSGETVILFGDGFGPTAPPFPDGQTLTQGLALPATPAINIGGAQAQVIYAGLTGPGLYQFNVVIPAAVTDGDAAVTTQYAGASTQSGVLISVQK